jgi:hypothetical protein
MDIFKKWWNMMVLFPHDGATKKDLSRILNVKYLSVGDC